MAEPSVGVRELKTHLSEYLRRVKAGQTITITEHGREVGRLIPVSKSAAERIEEMRRAGLAQWNGRKLPRSRPAARARGKKTVAELLLEDR